MQTASLTDSHCHLETKDFTRDGIDERPEVIARARAAGVARLVCVGSGAGRDEIDQVEHFHVRGVARAQPGGRALQHFAHDVELHHRLAIEPGDDEAVARLVSEHALRLEPANARRLYHDGLGVINVRDRLLGIYGEEGAFRIESAVNKGTRIRITLPIQTES